MEKGAIAVGEMALMALLQAATVNLGLFAFTILPIPPLDGSHVFLAGLRIAEEARKRLMRFGPYALLALTLIER